MRVVTREFVVVSPGMSSSTLVDKVEGYRERRLPSGCASRQVGGRRQPVHVSGHWTAGGTQWCRDDCEFGIMGQKCNAVQLEGDGGGEFDRARLVWLEPRCANLEPPFGAATSTITWRRSGGGGCW